MGPFAGGTSHPISPHFEPVPPSPIPMKKWEMGWEWAHFFHSIQMGQVCFLQLLFVNLKIFNLKKFSTIY